MGDSSGGGFALALAQKMREENNDKANQIILLSPWLDITLKNTNISALDSEDPVLGISGLQRAGKAYAGDSDPNNYLLSPINGQVEGLGKISIFIGTKDILEADTRRFKSITKEKGININYYEYKDMIHVWPLFDLPESKKAIEQIISQVRSL
jgi:epsilon-lactone hydrolase